MKVLSQTTKTPRQTLANPGLPRWLLTASHYLFFTGKGGVGKTSLACASALALADAGKRVLLVSTDPASNIQHVFETEIGEQVPTAIAGVPRLEALNIRPAAAAEAYRERAIAPMRGLLPDEAIKSMTEELSGSCTTEIAAFDQFTMLLTDPATSLHYDHIIFDTAPTGHTLRLLSLPAAWTEFFDGNKHGASCMGPVSALQAQRTQYAQAVARLHDPQHSTLVLVSRPEPLALAEAARTSADLMHLGLNHQRLIINGVFHAADPADPLAQSMESRGRIALASMPAELRQLPSDQVPLRAINLVGLSALRSMFQPNAATKAVGNDLPLCNYDSLANLLTDIETAGHGAVLVLGKGGVGKTTIAAAIALALADRGHHVHLTTTDPAAHINQTVQDAGGRLTLSRIDPQTETQAYRQQVMALRGNDLDEQGKALLEEDLRSPCTEEVAVFHAFSRRLDEASGKFVVIDTAPTGHSLLLLDATGSYHRDVMRNMTGKAQMQVNTALTKLQDPAHTKTILVTLPETTPIREAAELQADLHRAGIKPFAWVVNASLLAARPHDPLLVARALAERNKIEHVARELASRVAVVPWFASEPSGSQGLRQMITSTGSPTAQIKSSAAPVKPE
ncbi:MAG: arsenical pump-driving ATPase [Phycisphaerales bacterium]|nr:arsenical pump-driving ATPase [Phycisphaerales bacterium]